MDIFTVTLKSLPVLPVRKYSSKCKNETFQRLWMKHLLQFYSSNFLLFYFQILEIITFCILLYFYKRKAVKHIMILLMMVALLGKSTLFTLMFLSVTWWFLVVQSPPASLD